MDGEVAQLLVDEHTEVLCDDLVHVAMADDHAIAIWNPGAHDGIALFGWDGGPG